MVDKAEPRGTLESREQAAGWGLTTAMALLAFALLLAVVMSAPPTPKPASATDFSSSRARAVLRNLLGDGAPHPLGSPAEARLREGILAQLRELGYAPEVQEEVVCTPGGDCALVRNLLARLPGHEPGKSVLLSAHYDSVAAGPGASDDLAGVATVLEIARILKAGPTPRHGVLLLLNEGEETGLLGARAFVEHSPAKAEVGAVVNLEARGTSGPSLMFETCGPDAWIVSRFAAAAPSPFTSSLFVTIHRFMPNHTDLEEFRRLGAPGLGFAFIDNPSQYHSARDNFANLSAASLQHQGDNALAAVRGLTAADLAAPHQGRAVFFDLFHQFIVRWPAGLSPLFGILALGLTFAAAWRASRCGESVWGGSAVLGFVAALAALLFVLVLAFALRLLVAGAFPGRWVAQPQPALAAFWLLAFGGTLGLAGLLGRRSSLTGLWTGVWLFWSLLGLVLGIFLPGVSYLFLVPALVAGICGLAFAGSTGGRTAAAILPAFVVALLWFPLFHLLYIGLGFLGLPVGSVLLAVAFSTLTPLMTAGASAVWRRWLPLAALVAVLALAIVARSRPPFSPAAPQTMVLVAHEDALSGDTQWVAETGPPLPPAMRQAAAFAPGPVVAFPWWPSFLRAFVAPAPRLNAPGPDLTVLADSIIDGKRHLRLRLTSSRGAPVGNLYVPPEAKLEAMTIEGVPVLTHRAGTPPPTQQGWRSFTIYTLPAQGGEMQVVLGSTAPTEWYVVDQSYELPSFARVLLAARPQNAAPRQNGDATLVSRKVRI